MANLLSKKFGQLKQWTGEKMGQSQKTETSHEYKRLEQETESRRECIDKLQTSVDVFYKHISKRKDDPEDKAPKHPIQIMASAMSSYALMLSDQSHYGHALREVADVHEKIAIEQANLASFLRDGYLERLNVMSDEFKDFTNLKRKLENRRLDFDSKLNKVQKSRKEKPELEEEMRLAQTKYEETLANITEKMISLNSAEPDHYEELVQFVEEELSFHRRTTQLLEGLLVSIKGDKTFGSPKLTSAKTILRPLEQSPVARTRSVRTRQSSTSSHMSTYSARSGSEDPRRVLPITTSGLGSSIGILTDKVVNEPVASLSNPAVISLTPTQAKVMSHKVVEVMFDFDAEGPGELTMRKGELIEVTAEIDPGWWEGHIRRDPSRQGMFPSNYCQVISDPPLSAVPHTASPTMNAITTRLAETHMEKKGSNSAISSHGYLTPSSSAISITSMEHPSPSQAHTRIHTAASGFSDYQVLTSAKSTASIVSANTGTAPCGLCGCSDFIPHAFKPGQCNTCFHKH